MRQRMERLRAAIPPGIRVVPSNDKMRRLLRHPHAGGFRAEGGADWPNDRFTKRRLADGSIEARLTGTVIQVCSGLRRQKEPRAKSLEGDRVNCGGIFFSPLRCCSAFMSHPLRSSGRSHSRWNVVRVVLPD